MVARPDSSSRSQAANALITIRMAVAIPIEPSGADPLLDLLEQTDQQEQGLLLCLPEMFGRRRGTMASG